MVDVDVEVEDDRRRMEVSVEGAIGGGGCVQSLRSPKRDPEIFIPVCKMRDGEDV